MNISIRWLLAVTLTLALAPLVQAGEILKRHCPPPSYSPLHWLTPELWWQARYHHGLRGNYCPVARYPEVVPSYLIVPFPCPPVVPTEYPSPYVQARWAEPAK